MASSEDNLQHMRWLIRYVFIAGVEPASRVWPYGMLASNLIHTHMHGLRHRVLFMHVTCITDFCISRKGYHLIHHHDEQASTTASSENANGPIDLHTRVLVRTKYIIISTQTEQISILFA